MFSFLPLLMGVGAMATVIYGYLIGGTVAYIDLVAPLVLLGIAAILLGIFRWFQKKDKTFYERFLKTTIQKISDECEQKIARLSSDPLFLLEQARLYCEEQKELINKDLGKVDQELNQKVSKPLEVYERDLARWESSLTKLRATDSNRLPDKITMLDRAESTVNKYRQLVSEINPIKKQIDSKRALAQGQLQNLERGIQGLIGLETEYKALEAITADLRAEFGKELRDEYSPYQTLQYAEDINTALDECFGEIRALQIGIADMAQALPEPDKFCTNSQLQLVA